MMEWFSDGMRQATAKKLATYMLDMDMRTFIGFADSATPSVWSTFLEQDQIDAAFHWIKEDGACYSADPDLYENVQWVKAAGAISKPVVRGRVSLWDPQPTSSEQKHPHLCGTPESVAKVLNALPRDSSDAQSGFSMVPVRIHGSRPVQLEDVAKAISMLEDGVEVVGAFEFVERLQGARGRGLGGAI